MKHSSVFKTVYAALFAALVFVGTQVLKIPLIIGYFNLGDPFVLLAGYMIGGTYGAAAAAIGSVLADGLSGYAIYIPATLVIKPAAAWTVFTLCRKGAAKTPAKKHLLFVFAATVAELLMVLSYLTFDMLLYGFQAALLSLPGNLLQGVLAVITSTVAVLLLDKTNLLKIFRP